MKSGTVLRGHREPGWVSKELHLRWVTCILQQGGFILPQQAENSITVRRVEPVFLAIQLFVVLLLCSAVVLCPVISETQREYEGGGGHSFSWGNLRKLDFVKEAGTLQQKPRISLHCQNHPDDFLVFSSFS